jgi:hypothetical protein
VAFIITAKPIQAKKRENPPGVIEFCTTASWIPEASLFKITVVAVRSAAQITSQWWLLLVV